MKAATMLVLCQIVLRLARVKGDAANLDEIINQLCTSWGGSVGRHFSSPRVGKAGPRGIPGPVGPPGIVNETAIRLMMRDEIALVLTERLSLESCTGVREESVKARKETGGIFDIYPFGIKPLEVYCDTETDGGGWTVFQRRIDGSVNFFRGWNDYVNGFGDKQREFWLGLEAIHQMTKNGDHELRIDLIKTDGTRQYAKYWSFAVGPASDYYRLSVSGHSGNAGDRLSYHHNMQFTTKDKDHDAHSSLQCASYRSGAWWYNACAYSNLNGLFGKGTHKGLEWNGYDYRFTEMKFRKKN